MPSLDRQQCRGRLNELLSAEYTCAGLLQSVLQAEAQALLARDLDELGRLVSEKHRLILQFEQLDADRRHLLGEFGHENDPAGVEAFIAWCDDTGHLVRGWKSLLERLRDCQQLNRVNGVTLESSRRHAQNILGILRGHPALPDLYSPTGTSAQPAIASRSLAKA